MSGERIPTDGELTIEMLRAVSDNTGGDDWAWLDDVLDDFVAVPKDGRDFAYDLQRSGYVKIDSRPMGIQGRHRKPAKTIELTDAGTKLLNDHPPEE